MTNGKFLVFCKPIFLAFTEFWKLIWFIFGRIYTGWATGLSAGESIFSMNFSFFQVVINLTDVGQGTFSLSFFLIIILSLIWNFVLLMLEHMQDVIGLLFKYISLLKQSGICQWIFDEVCAFITITLLACYKLTIVILSSIDFCSVCVYLICHCVFFFSGLKPRMVSEFSYAMKKNIEEILHPHLVYFWTYSLAGRCWLIQSLETKEY